MSRSACALVSTSGALLARNDGPRIDAHDRVIRTGQGPIHGFEAHVGGRTDYRVMSIALYEKSRRMNITSLKQQIQDGERVVYTKDTGRCKRAAIMHPKMIGATVPFTCFVHARQCRALAAFRRDLSSGLEAAVFAFQVLGCGTLTPFGFNTTENERALYHYWRDGSRHDSQSGIAWYRSRMKGGHDFRSEHHFLRSLTTPSGVITQERYKQACIAHSASPAATLTSGARATQPRSTSARLAAPHGPRARRSMAWSHAPHATPLSRARYAPTSRPPRPRRPSTTHRATPRASTERGG